MPFEFCEWSPLFKKCKDNFTQNWKVHFPEVDGDDELAALMARLGFEGGDAASKKAQSAKKAQSDDAGGTPVLKSKKEKPPPEIVIELNNRNKKKHITVVKGLEPFYADTAAAAKVFGKKFACGSALKKGQDGKDDQIEIQGSYRDELPAVMVDKLKVGCLPWVCCACLLTHALLPFAPRR
jgi:density-regulated protein DRP1